MFGPFKPSSALLGGLLWKNPWRMSSPQKQRLRNRLKTVDKTIEQITLGLHLQRSELKGISYQDALNAKEFFKPRSKQLRLLNKSSFFPKEHEMRPLDKYTTYVKSADNYRKSVHKVPKWTKKSNRVNPEYF